MAPALAYRIAADIVLLLHAGFVGFVVLGLLLIVVGKLRAWHWVHNRWFRIAHLGAIAVVVLQAWLGAVCPLTLLEMYLRQRAGDAIYPGAFIAHWVEQMLYFTAPAWVFGLAYTVFGALVLATWFWVKPRKRRADS